MATTALKTKMFKFSQAKLNKLQKQTKNMYCFGARLALQNNSNHAAVDIYKR